ncbi:MULTISPECIES: porin [Pseudoalteromonas]|uniref:porin n=1 Tax=Pseudoalteromonas TaxID=53246 RepID=UPI00029ACFB9|nr:MULTISPECIES: porin [Pseudoalteromonas]MBR8845880.1 porin [Pseudoalteromonas sp. JC3]MCF2827312.1 porin [Pseudoalteromonas sp. OF5H-5]MCF2834597.1 porin [Pseudoalteromonas sp. DL2-H6]MCF2923357.1 porin [Pseudoalteromonas sp. DL2-H1]MCF7514481.1 porin [Pseudoalteromonas sp. L7]
MKLTKTALALSLLSAFTFQANAEVDVYGKANVSVQSSDDGAGSVTEIKSNASRFGFKGSEKLDSGLEVIYKLEFQVDVSDADSKGDKDNITARNQYVGLKGNFGEVVIGRNDTALKQSQGKLDQFNDLEGDIKVLFKGENRLGDSISYKSPSFNGFRVLGSFIAEDSEEGENGFSTALTYGDAGLKESAVYAAIAADSEVNGYDTVRFTVQGKVADFKLGAMYQTQEKVDGSAEADGYLLNAAYKLGNATLKAQYQVIDFDAGDKVDGVSVGVDYKLAKNAKVYGFYSTFDADNQVEKDYLGLGIEYKF